MAFKMKNPFKQDTPAVAESTGVTEVTTPVVEDPKKCYVTDPTTGKKKEIPCINIKGKGGEGKVYNPTSKEIKEFSKYQRGAGGTFVKHG